MSGAVGTALLCIGALLVLTPAASAAPPPPVLYGAVGGNGTSQLYSIDPATGAGTPIGDIGNAVTGLAEDPTTGVLYGVTSARAITPRTLITINKSTGAGTVVGPLGQRIADISFNSSGQLFGWAEGPDRLASIDKTTGVATPIGTTSYDTYGDGESFDKNDVLYDMSSGDQVDLRFSPSGQLWTVDTSTSVPTTVATLSGSPYPPGTDAAIGAASFACDRTTLYAADNNFGTAPTYLTTVNTATGAITTIGTTITGLDALEWSCPQQIGFTVSSTTVNQSAGTVTLTVTRTGGMKGAVSVHYATADGTATAGVDYTASSGTLTFANNQTTQTITIPIRSEGPDAAETFSVNLSAPTAGATLGIASESVTIAAVPSPPGKLRLTVSPHSAKAHVRTCYAFRASSGGHGVSGVRVRFGGKSVKTHAGGRAQICVKLRAGTYHARASKTGFTSASARVRVRAVHVVSRPAPRFTG